MTSDGCWSRSAGTCLAASADRRSCLSSIRDDRPARVAGRSRATLPTERSVPPTACETEQEEEEADEVQVERQRPGDRDRAGLPGGDGERHLAQALGVPGRQPGEYEHADHRDEELERVVLPEHPDHRR